MKIHDRYRNELAEVPQEEGEAILAYAKEVRQNVGMGQSKSPAPEGVTVKYTHTYGQGSAEVYYCGSQIASA